MWMFGSSAHCCHHCQPLSGGGGGTRYFFFFFCLPKQIFSFFPPNLIIISFTNVLHSSVGPTPTHPTHRVDRDLHMCRRYNLFMVRGAPDDRSSGGQARATTSMPPYSAVVGFASRCMPAGAAVPSSVERDSGE